MVGRLFLSEIILVAMTPFLVLSRGGMLLSRLPKRLLFFGFAWLLAQVISDVVRVTPFEDWSRGWAKIAFVLFNFSAIYLLLNGSLHRAFLFGVGLCIGQVLTFFFNSSVFAEEYPWKFGYGAAVTTLAVLASQFELIQRRGHVAALLVGMMGFVNFALGFRSLGLICLLTAGFLIAKRSRRIHLARLTRSEVAVLGVLATAAIVGVASLYEHAARQGWLGAEQEERYTLQSSGDIGILAGGRSEFLSSIEAVADSPIIGHGSWAKNPKYVDLLVNILRERGYEVRGEADGDLIPSHSHVMGAWVDAGVIGALFWAWAFVLTIQALVWTYAVSSRYVPLIAYVCFTLLWNIPFSPLGAEARLMSSFHLAVVVLVITAVGQLRKGKA